MTIEAAHKTILEYLQKHSPVNTFRLSRHLGIDRIELIKIIEKLTNEGFAKFEHGAVTKVSDKPEGTKELPKAIKILGNTHPHHEFHFCNGLYVKNLHELLLAFETITDDVYGYHANEQKNDFSSWIKDVFEDEELASNLRIKDKEEAIAILNDRLEFLKEQIN